MFKPLIRLRSHDQGKKPRMWIVLGNGGRAVGRCREPLGGNMVMVPTEIELKSILYDQVTLIRDAKSHEAHQIIKLTAPNITLFTFRSNATPTSFCAPGRRTDTHTTQG